MDIHKIFVVVSNLFAVGLCQTARHLNYTEQATTSTLKLVQMVFRHGDRSPIGIFPSDVHQQADSWPQGLGQLTPRGMEQGHELGTFLRNRYNGHISTKYNLSDLYVRSSDVDRSILTAQNLLTGLYPSSPQSDKKGNIWTPVTVPIHTVPGDYDYMVRFSANCPTVQDIDKSLEKDTKYALMFEKLKDLVELARNYSGYDPFDDEASMTGRVRDTLVCERWHNMSAPGWVTQYKFIERMNNEWFRWSYGKQFSPRKAAKFRGGVVLQDMALHMQACIEGSDKRKMYLYSGHDTTVGAILGALGTYNGLNIPYTSSVILELHSSEQHNFTVCVFYRNGTGNLYQLSIPDCDADCPYLKFLELTSDVRPVDIYKECHSFDVLGFKVPLLLGLDRVMTITVVSITAGLLLIIFLVCCIRATRKCCRRRHIRNRRKVRTLNSIMPETVKLVSSGISDSEDEFR